VEEPVMGDGEKVSRSAGPPPVLYTCAGSRGLRVTWTAVELGIGLDYRLLPFPPREKARDYLEINPLGTVPALFHDGYLLTESSAIAQYLATRWGPTSLAIEPGEQDYGAFLDFLHHADATLTFPQTVWLRFARFERERGLQQAGEAYADWFSQRLIKAQQRLASREFLCSDRFTVADIAVTYALHLATMTGLDHLVPEPLEDYRARMTGRPAFARAIATEKEAARSQGVS
jgi:glutathione S-transferase